MPNALALAPQGDRRHLEFMTDEIILRPFTAGDADWLTRQHEMLYARDEGFDETFGVLVAQILSDFLADHDPKVESGWIAQMGPARMGSIFCMASGTPGVAKLRLFLLRPQARGHGLGRRMLRHCIEFARQARYAQMVLWTHESHAAACALYLDEGFTLNESLPKTSFGQDVVEQHFSIAL